MKKNIFLLLTIMYVGGLKAQPMDHVTIASLEIVYTEDPAGNFVPDSVRKVRANAHIILKNSASLSKIHLVIKHAMDDAVIYEATYQLASPLVTNEEGMTLYKKEEDNIYISSAGFMTLTSYKYEISTEDTGAVVSPVYSSIQ